MIEVQRAGGRLIEALDLQFQSLPNDERSAQIQQLAASHAEGNISLDDCLIVSDDEQIAGVQLLVRQRDQTTYVWPAVVRPEIPAASRNEILQSLYQNAVTTIDASRVWIAQTLLEQDDTQQSQVMSRNGFPRLTELLFMSRSLTLPVPGMNIDWQLVEFDEEDNARRFAETIELSYHKTMDCPELNGHRTGIEALNGHRLSGEFDPSRWLLFTKAGRDVGILLMTAHSAEQVWEVVYFGLVPDERGRGYGRRIMCTGLELASRAGAQEMVLAVDVRNRPAIKLYEDLGFSEFDRRIVHARLRNRTDA